MWINTHFNHPDELTPAAVKGLGMLADAGIPLGCQTVLLRGVNDTPEVMKQLMHRLMLARVRPYYIYMADQVAGAEHFRTSVQTGIQIMESLRGWTSGLANPQFVIDAPGGGGKIPLLPEYVISMNDEEVVLRNFAATSSCTAAQRGRGDGGDGPPHRSRVSLPADVAVEEAGEANQQDSEAKAGLRRRQRRFIRCGREPAPSWKSPPGRCRAGFFYPSCPASRGVERL